MAIAEDLHSTWRARTTIFPGLVVAEGGGAVSRRATAMGGRQFVFVDGAHAAAASAQLALSMRVAEAAAPGGRIPCRRAGAGGGDHGHPDPFGECPRRHLVAEFAHHAWGGADENDAGGGAGLGELRFSDQETVPRDGSTPAAWRYG